jgi:hypothetical protein
MQHADFYLSSSDYVSTPGPRECVVAGQCLVFETGEQLTRVAVSPLLPGELVSQRIAIHYVLLNLIVPGSQVFGYGRLPVMVDIYFQTNGLEDACRLSELQKIGCGLLHATLADALKSSPLGD